MSFIDSPFVDVHVCWQPPFPRSCRSTGQRLPALLFLTLLLLGLAGCGSADGSHGYADRPPSNRTALVAWQEWTRFGRSTVVYGGAANGYTNRAGDERAQRAAEQPGRRLLGKLRPSRMERPDLGPAVVRGVRVVGDDQVRRQPERFSRPPAATANISRRFTTASTAAAARASRCMRRTNMPPRKATWSAPARPARPGATPIHAPRGGGSTIR